MNIKDFIVMFKNSFLLAHIQNHDFGKEINFNNNSYVISPHLFFSIPGSKVIVTGVKQERRRRQLKTSARPDL